ncbi:TPA: lpg0045 family Dot/Icm T4SS effector [Legionella pneumophila]|nr:lpg0045 family Dot/Icm T4SS effector [Legionella pneumophila]HAT2066452.1 lpg0045 family Dot/Icm T4SS effector [Legionella pneumophila]HAT8592293.1 lpg0045 family Dot/Icm T4SS effector [Legionella pneumophila]HAU1576841.1 lpg0045 family Dot/Icm T4SS effector [Legionella pneumophila]HAU1680840.1 lpg0045 family Dot/Icm T4SS effector [Legionella pneumophila]HAU3700535.1 lpg0045 family Dot/Icm T4SS effector [Legionella pneumophila]
MKSTNNMQKKETDKPTSEQAQKKEVRRNNAPDFIPSASPYYNLYCFFYKLCHGEDTSRQHQPATSFQHGK